MCIIIAKNKKTKRLPTKKELINCFEYNSDGAGFMYVDNNRVVIDKGYMEENEFLNRFEYLCKKYNNFKNKSLVIHCRIGTSSGNTPQNTHPYIITNNEKDLHKTFISSDIGIAHNGIIYDYTPTEKAPTTNDTQEFIIKYLYPLYSHYKDFYKQNTLLNGIQKITNSKFALLNNDDELYLIGDFIKERGLYFSNSSYKDFYNYKNYNKYDDEYYSNKYLDEYFEKDYTEIEDHDDDYYDDYEDFLYVSPKWYIYNDTTGDWYSVPQYPTSNDLYYNPFTFELFEKDYNNTFLKVDDNIILYDENYKEVV